MPEGPRNEWLADRAVTWSDQKNGNDKWGQDRFSHGVMDFHKGVRQNATRTGKFKIPLQDMYEFGRIVCTRALFYNSTV